MVSLLARLAGLASLISMAALSEADITFNCVGYPSTAGGSFGVSIGGAITKLASTEANFPVWSGAVPGTTSAAQYSYVELNAAGAAVRTEAFIRTIRNATDTHTYNEFFERQTTKWVLPHVPYSYLATWPSYTKIFDDDVIATIHVTADPAQMAALNANPNLPTDIKVNFRWIDHKMIYSQNNITFKTSGKSSKDFQKQAYKFSFDTNFNQSFFSRPNIKLRSEVTDPTVMREKLYIDMLNAVGVPTQQSQYVRLFINSQPYGLYLMVDDIKKSFIKQTVYQGDPAAVIGSLVQMNAPTVTNQADLLYKGPTNASYDPVVYADVSLGNNPVDQPLNQLITFMADLQAFDPVATPDPVGYWNNTRLDLDGFLRNMALEYLAGAFDNYWMSGSNYFMYFNAQLGSSGKWQWIPTDFDGTFGNGFPTNKLSSYQTFYSFTPDHPLVSKLIIKNKEINALFEQTLKDIVGWSFKPEGLFPRIMAYNQMLAEDYKWDLAIARTGPGVNNNYTFDDFNNNLDNVTKDMQASLKGWITDASTLVAAQLSFTIQAGAADRVAPPPKPTHNKDGDPKGDNNGAAMFSGSWFLTALAVSASLITLF